MTGRRGGRPLVPAYLSTGGEARPSRNSLERLSVLTGLVGGPGSTPTPDGSQQQAGSVHGDIGRGSRDRAPQPGERPNSQVSDVREGCPGYGETRTGGPPTASPSGGSRGRGHLPPDDCVPLPPGPGQPRSAGPAPSGTAPGQRRNQPLPTDLAPAQRSLLETLDGGSLTVVETAALLELPVSAVRVLAAQLIDRGLIAARGPIPYAAKPRPDLLERVADGLRALKL